LLKFLRASAGKFRRTMMEFEADCLPLGALQRFDEGTWDARSSSGLLGEK
jgi:hypothetical protein